MKVNLQNIVNTAIERGLFEGYYAITDDKFKGTADEAVETLYNSVIFNLGEFISFDEDEKTQKQKSIGFSRAEPEMTDVTSDTTIEVENDDGSNEEENSVKKLPKLKRSR